MKEDSKAQYKKKVAGNFNINKGNNQGNSLRFTMTQKFEPISKKLLDNNTDKYNTLQPHKIIEQKINIQNNIVESIKLLLPALNETGLKEVQSEITKLLNK